MSNKLPKLNIRPIRPMTENQGKIFDAFYDDKNLFINGSAGTGKTFVSLFLALNELQDQTLDDMTYHNITIVRSAVPSREVGFLPGDLNEKLAVYEHPYRIIVDHLFESDGTYDALKRQEYINFVSTSYMRGLTIDNSIVIVDESENLQFKELNTVMTRMGQNSKIIFCGDFFQSDLKGSNERNGMKTFMKIVTNMYQFEHIEMNESDIVRSQLIKDYIMKMNEILSGRNINNGVQPNPVTA